MGEIETSRFCLEWLVTPADAGVLLRDFLRKNQVSRRALTDVKFAGGRIYVNGSEVTVRHVLADGDRVQLVFPAEALNERMLGETLPLSIVYEDDWLLVVDKQAGMSTIPSREHPTGSLANGLVEAYAERGLKRAVHIVTRLDRDTSGLVLVAKHRHIQHLLERTAIQKEYLAAVQGAITEASGIIEAPIGRAEDSIIAREVRADGQYACTLYERVAGNAEISWLRLRLKTGRTHQIRVHLAHIGHPILGDELYGGDRTLISRQSLHCARLNFIHPMTGEMVNLEADCPPDMHMLYQVMCDDI